MGENNNYLVINGVKITLTDEQLKDLNLDKLVKSVNPFERAKLYYTINNGVCGRFIDENDAAAISAYNSVNYFNNKDFAEKVKNTQLLYRKLLKFGYENGCLSGEDDEEYHCIEYNYLKEKYVVIFVAPDELNPTTVYFKSSYMAQKAIFEVVEPFVKETGFVSFFNTNI